MQVFTEITYLSRVNSNHSRKLTDHVQCVHSCARLQEGEKLCIGAHTFPATEKHVVILEKEEQGAELAWPIRRWKPKGGECRVSSKGYSGPGRKWPAQGRWDLRMALEDDSSSHRPISEAKNMSEEMVRGPLRSPCLGESNSAYLSGAEVCVQCKF